MTTPKIINAFAIQSLLLLLFLSAIEKIFLDLFACCAFLPAGEIARERGELFCATQCFCKMSGVVKAKKTKI